MGIKVRLSSSTMMPKNITIFGSKSSSSTTYRSAAGTLAKLNHQRKLEGHTQVQTPGYIISPAKDPGAVDKLSRSIYPTDFKDQRRCDTPFLDLMMGCRHSFLSSNHKHNALLKNKFTGNIPTQQLLMAYGIYSLAKHAGVGQLPPDFKTRVQSIFYPDQWGFSDEEGGKSTSKFAELGSLHSKHDNLNKVLKVIKTGDTALPYRVQLPLTEGNLFASMPFIQELLFGKDPSIQDSRTLSLATDNILAHLLEGDSIQDYKFAPAENSPEFTFSTNLAYFKRMQPVFIINQHNSATTLCISLGVTEKEACYIAGADFIKDISIHQLLEAMINWVTPTGRSSPAMMPTRNPVTLPIINVAKKVLANPPKPRVGELGCVTMPDGDIVYIPPSLSSPEALKFLEAYEQSLNLAHSNDEDTRGNTAVHKARPEFLPKPGPLFADWSNHKLIFNDHAGRYDPVISLVNTSPTTYTHILRFLNRELKDVELSNHINAYVGIARNDFGIDIGSLPYQTKDSKDGSPVSKLLTEVQERYSARLGYPTGLFNMVPFSTVFLIAGDKTDNGEPVNPPYGIHNLDRELDNVDVLRLERMGESFNNLESIDNQSINESLRTSVVPSRIAADIIRVAQELNTALSQNPNYVPSSYLGMCGLGIARAIATIAAMPAPSVSIGRLASLKAKAGQETNIYRGISKTRLNVVPNKRALVADSQIDGPGRDIQLQYHQVQTDAMLNESPPNAMIGAEPGGGKTITVVMDVLNHIQKGNKGPFIIVCPDNLISGYVAEALFVTNDRLNVLPISSSIYKSWSAAITSTAKNGTRRKVQPIYELMRSAPTNTIYVVGRNALIAQSYGMTYAGTSHTVYPVVEMLKSFNPTYIAVDEAHVFKNLDSESRKALDILKQNTKYRRVVTGTMADNTIEDIVSVAGICDPTVLGTPAGAGKKYMTEAKTGRNGTKSVPLKNAEFALRSNLNTGLALSVATRKEWSRILPPEFRSFVNPSLTSLQQLVHDAMLCYNLKLNFTAISDPGNVTSKGQLQNWLSERILHALTELGASPEVVNRPEVVKREVLGTLISEGELVELEDGIDEEDKEGIIEVNDAKEKKIDAFEDEFDSPIDVVESVDEANSNTMSADLRLVFNALEGFCSDPSRQEKLMRYFCTELLQLTPQEVDSRLAPGGKDLSTAKVDAIIQILDKHFDPKNGTPGKVIIFCNYVQSRRNIIQALPDKYKRMVVEYEAANKAVHLSEFLNNPQKQILVGIQNSLSTGHNLQIASRIIRAESRWTPGEVIQGDARIVRPNLKTSETRRGVYIDTIATNNSVEVTKLAYLMAKQISLIKFQRSKSIDLSSDVTYSDLDQERKNEFLRVESGTVFKMNGRNIAEKSSLDAVQRDYLRPFAELSSMIVQDNIEYEKNHIDDLYDVTPAQKAQLIKDLDAALKLPRNNLEDRQLALVRAHSLPLKRTKVETDPDALDNPEFTKLINVPFCDTMALYVPDPASIQTYTEFLDNEQFQTRFFSLKNPNDGTYDIKAYNELELAFYTEMGMPKVYTERGIGKINKFGQGGISVSLDFPEGASYTAKRTQLFILASADIINRHALYNSILSGSKLEMTEVSDALKNFTGIQTEPITTNPVNPNKPLVNPNKAVNPNLPKPKTQPPAPVKPVVPPVQKSITPEVSTQIPTSTSPEIQERQAEINRTVQEAKERQARLPDKNTPAGKLPKYVNLDIEYTNGMSVISIRGPSEEEIARNSERMPDLKDRAPLGYLRALFKDLGKSSILSIAPAFFGITLKTRGQLKDFIDTAEKLADKYPIHPTYMETLYHVLDSWNKSGTVEGVMGMIERHSATFIRNMSRAIPPVPEGGNKRTKYAYIHCAVMENEQGTRASVSLRVNTFPSRDINFSKQVLIHIAKQTPSLAGVAPRQIGTDPYLVIPVVSKQDAEAQFKYLTNLRVGENNERVVSVINSKNFANALARTKNSTAAKHQHNVLVSDKSNATHDTIGRMDYDAKKVTKPKELMPVIEQTSSPKSNPMLLENSTLTHWTGPNKNTIGRGVEVRLSKDELEDSTLGAIKSGLNYTAKIGGNLVTFAPLQGDPSTFKMNLILKTPEQVKNIDKFFTNKEIEYRLHSA